MKKMTIPMIALVSLVFVFTMSSMTCIAAETSEPMTIRFADASSPSTFFGKHHMWWAEQVEKRTGGRLKIKVYPMQSLVKMRDMLEGIQSGLTEVGFLMCGYFPNYFPYFLATSPIYNMHEYYVPVLLAINETMEEVPALRAEIEKQNVIKLATHTGGNNILGTKKCMESIEGVKGMIIRSATGTRTEFWKYLGAKPVFLPQSALYDAVDRGTVDGLAGINVCGVESRKLHEVIKCLYMTNHGTSITGGMFMNLKVFKKLPKDIQGELLKLREDYDVRFAEALQKEEASDLANMEARHGVKVQYPTAREKKILLEAATKANEYLIKKTEEKGFPGAQKSVDYYFKALEKYEKQYAQAKK